MGGGGYGREISVVGGNSIQDSERKSGASLLLPSTPWADTQVFRSETRWCKQLQLVDANLRGRLVF